MAPSRPFLSRALEIFREEVNAIKTVSGLVPNFICYPMQRNAISAMTQRGGNALGIHTDGPLFSMYFRHQATNLHLLTTHPVILISTAWSNSTDDTAVNQMTANVVERLNGTAQDLGVANRYKYINYASAAQAGQIFPGYGDENMQRLKSIQKAVDTRGVFTAEGLWHGFVKLQ